MAPAAVVADLAAVATAGTTKAAERNGAASIHKLAAALGLGRAGALLLGATRAEEASQLVGALLLEDARRHIELVVEALVMAHVEQRSDAP